MQEYLVLPAAANSAPGSAGETLSPVAHTLRIEKLTEGRPDAGGVVELVGLRAAKLLPPQPPLTRRVECIGDSIMCGAHSERGDSSWASKDKAGFAFPPSCKNEKGGSNENSYMSWCPTLARRLKADYQMECCSGNGLVFTDNPLSKFDCPWGQLPNRCPNMQASWPRRLECAKRGVFFNAR